MVYWQARALEMVAPGIGLAEWLRSSVERLDAKFGSWRMREGEDDPLDCADPQLVAALEFIASLIADEKDTARNS